MAGHRSSNLSEVINRPSGNVGKLVPGPAVGVSWECLRNSKEVKAAELEDRQGAISRATGRLGGGLGHPGACKNFGFILNDVGWTALKGFELGSDMIRLTFPQSCFGCCV